MPIPINSEEFCSIPVSGVDVSELKRAEQNLAVYQAELIGLVDEKTQELQETETNLISAIESISEGFILYYANDHFVMCNEKYRDFYPLIRDDLVPGAQLEDVARKRFERGVVKGSAENTEYWLQLRLAQQKTAQGSNEQEPPDGRWVLCSERKAANGYTVGIRTDITEMKQAADRLRRSQRIEAVGQLTGGIAHDFKNILAVIVGNLDLINENNIDHETGKKSVTTALNAALRGADLTHRLLAFSRQQSLQPRKIQVNEMLPQFSQLAERTIGEDIDIKMNLAGNLWPVMVDPGELENALLNLAINARDAMPDGGQLTLETSNQKLERDIDASEKELTPGQYVVIAVSDSGSGMTAEIREHVFEPFFTTKEVGKGSGLGLSMVFGFAKQSGGHVSIYSEPGEGTTVKICLPKFVAKSSANENVIPPPSNIPKGGETILVVEDDKDLLEYLVTVLTRLGYLVLPAEDGPAALEVMAATEHIDLLLTDVILPRGMTGSEVAAAFRIQYPNAAMLYSSGYTPEVLSRRGRLVEDVPVMNKPYQASTLATQIRTVLGQHG